MVDNQVDAARKVAENTAAGQAIGNPVVATDGDDDILTYTLGGAAADVFDIDWDTGQLRTKAKLDFEAPVDADTDNVYVVEVRATDPDGMPGASSAEDMNADTIMVNITVTDVDEAPAFTAGDAEVDFEENGDITLRLGADEYVANDPETSNDPTLALAGVDRAKFALSNVGALTFKDTSPNFEAPGDANKDNVYEVTVEAADGVGNTGTKAVKVTVTNVEEVGTVTLTQLQPRVGVALTASVTDLDGDVSGVTWQWGRSAQKTGSYTDIPKATSATYKPVEGDANPDQMYLEATASYTDGHGDMKTASGKSANPVALDTRNRPPAFDDQDDDTMGIQNDETTRKVAENTKAASPSDDAVDTTDDATDNVGSPVTATDPAPNTDALVYTLEGADASSFTVRQDDPDTDQVGEDEGGQIEVASGTELDYETKQTYMVTVRAADSFGESDTIMVTIMVTPVDEAPEIMLGGLVISGMSSVYYAEKSMGVVETYMAAGPEADMADCSLGGDDAGAFSISADGMLRFMSSPDYENPMDMGMDNMYMVTIMASDGTYMDTHDVMVMVTNEDEPGRVTFWRDEQDATTAAIMVGDMLTGLAEDPDGNVGDMPPITDMYPNITGATWQWAKSMDMNTWMDIAGATDAAYMVMEGDNGYYLRATAMYTDGEGTGKMASEKTMMVTAIMEQMGEVTLWAGMDALTMAPQVGETITGAVMDPDGGEMVESWQWARTMTPDMMDSWMDIAGETNAAYMVMEGDTGYYLRVMATYTDAVGTDMAMVYSMPTMMVTMNASPMFDSETGTREVAENTAAGMDIGDPVTATDADDDTLTYALGGMDAASFDIGSATGQLMTKAALDYEMPRGDEMSDTNTNDYMVTVTATDPEGASDMITVTITVTDVVNEEMTLLQRYDANGDDMIDKSEVVAAINAYLDSVEGVSKADVIAVINLYLG